VTLPIFNQNQGLIARAEAEVERAVSQQRTLHDRIIMEVEQAQVRVEQAALEYKVLETQVRPEVELAIRRAEIAYREGDTPFVVVLQTSRQLIDMKLRRVQLEADLQRSWAELERSVGRKLLVVPSGAEELPAALPDEAKAADAEDGRD
jgi:cobalt-zinc-cadmium efflux system outer membrane protein